MSSQAAHSITSPNLPIPSSSSMLTLPSQTTIVRHWSKWIFLSSGLAGVVTAIVGIVNNDSVKLYAGVFLFVTNTLGYFTVTDLHSLEEQLAEMAQINLELENTVKELRAVQDELETQLASLEQLIKNYQNSQKIFNEQIDSLREINESIGESLPHVEVLKSSSDNIQLYTETLERYVEKFQEETKVSSLSRENISSDLKVIRNQVETFSLKIQHYTSLQENIIKEKRELTEVLARLTQENHFFAEEQKRIKEQIENYMAHLNSFKGNISIMANFSAKEQGSLEKLESANAQLARSIDKLAAKILDWNQYNALASMASHPLTSPLAPSIFDPAMLRFKPATPLNLLEIPTLTTSLFKV